MDKKRKLLMTLLVVLAVFIVNRYTGEIFNGIKTPMWPNSLVNSNVQPWLFWGRSSSKKRGSIVALIRLF